LGDDGEAKPMASHELSSELPPEIRQLAHAMAGQPMTDDLVPLDVAAREPPSDVPSAKMRRPAECDEMATTSKDLPVFEMPEVQFTAEERRKEIEELRTSLGLRIDEPAADSQEDEQMSALAIDLAPGRRHTPDPSDRQKSGHLPVPSASPPKIRQGMRPIEERNRHLAPPPLPPSRAAAKPATAGESQPALPAPRPRRGLVIVLLLALLLVAGTVAVLLIR
jgi:hypothetical protein